MSGIDCTVILEMADYLLYSVTTSEKHFLGSSLPLNPDDYDGATYYFEIVASNSNATTDYLVRLIDGDGSTVATLTVPKTPSGPINFIRIRSNSFTAADTTYHIQMPQTAGVSQVYVAGARIVIVQQSATKTRVQIPMVHDGAADATGADYVFGTSYSQGIAKYFNYYKRDASEFAGSSLLWTFEAVHSRFISGKPSNVSLFNVDGGAQISASALSTLSAETNPAVQSVDIDSSDLPDQTVVQVKHHGENGSELFRCCMYVKILGATLVSAYNRVSKRFYTAGDAYTPQDAGRILAAPNAGESYLEVTAYRSTGTGGQLEITSDENNDTGVDDWSTAVSISDIGSTKNRYRSGSFNAIGDQRYTYRGLGGTGAYIETSAAFMVCLFRPYSTTDFWPTFARLF